MFTGKHMRKPVMIVGLLLAVGIVAFVFEIISNPLRRSVDAIRESSLREVPIGSSEDFMANIAKIKGWGSVIRFAAKNHKIGLNDGSGLDPKVAPLNGENLYRINMGYYSNIFRIDVESYWIFNADGKLTELRIQKELDAL